MPKKPLINISIKNENNQQSKNKNLEPPPPSSTNIPTAYQPYYSLSTNLWKDPETARQLENKGYTRPTIPVQPPPYYESIDGEEPVYEGVGSLSRDTTIEPPLSTIGSIEPPQSFENDILSDRENVLERQRVKIEDIEESFREDDDDVEEPVAAGAAAAGRYKGSAREREIVRMITNKDITTKTENNTIVDNMRIAFQNERNKDPTHPRNKEEYHRWMIDEYRGYLED